MNAPRHEIEARRAQVKAVDRATEQLLAFELPLSGRAVNDVKGLIRTMWPLFVSEVVASKDMKAELHFVVTLDVANGDPKVSVEVKSEGLPKAKPPVWKVHVYVCGKHSGAYEFTDGNEARADMEQRKRDYSVHGCSYRIEEPNVQAQGHPQT